MMRFICFLILFFVGTVYAQTLQQCTGTDMPYNEPKFIEITPDHLTPFFINHLGRHGARYPVSDHSVHFLKEVLEEAGGRNKLSPGGRELLSLTLRLNQLFDGHWGMLSDLGVTEQQNIAKRIYTLYPDLWKESGTVCALSDSVPRCIRSMEAFCNELSRHDPYIGIKQESGRSYDSILRFYDRDSLYTAYEKSGDWRHIYEAYRDSVIPLEAADPLFTDSLSDLSLRRTIVSALFEMLSALPAVGMDSSFETCFTNRQAVDLWKAANLRQYLLKSTSPVGRMIPVDCAKPLLQNFIATADSVIGNQLNHRAVLRFAHAETLIPFAALLRIRMADEVVSASDSVSFYWKDYRIAPMAANIQWIFFRDRQNAVWVKFLLNERPVLLSLAAADPPYYLWEDVRNFFQSILSRKQDFE